MKIRIKKIFAALTLLLCLLPVLTRAQNALTYTTNISAITITGFVGPSSDVTNVVVSDTINGYPVTSIGNGAFYNCTNLKKVVIGANVTNIVKATGQGSFYGCASLTNLTVATGNPAYGSVNGVIFNKTQTTLILFPEGLSGNYTIPNGVTNISNYAFQLCLSLTSVIIPNGVTSIDGEAFENCTGLSSVTIPNSVTNIGNYAFYQCYSLTNVTIPNSVTYLGNSFSGCSGLRSVTIPNSVTSIGNSAFYHCSSLGSVTIPASVTSIGDIAFANCTSLMNITFLGNAPTLGVGVFNGSILTDPVTVYYYYGTTGWGATYGGRPTVMLGAPSAPQIGGSGNVGIQAGKFSFTLSGVSNQTFVVEASTNLLNWQPVLTNTFSGTSTNFTDAQWTNFPRRFYRAR